MIYIPKTVISLMWQTFPNMPKTFIYMSKIGHDKKVHSDKPKTYKHSIKHLSLCKTTFELVPGRVFAYKQVSYDTSSKVSLHAYYNTHS